jgi:hypothetical protein
LSTFRKGGAKRFAQLFRKGGAKRFARLFRKVVLATPF